MRWQATAHLRQAEVHLRAVGEHQHEGAADAAEDVGDEALVERGRALLPRDRLEAVDGPLVDVLLHRLLALHLETTANGVEGIGGSCSDGDGRLRRCEGGKGAEHTRVRLVRVDAGDGVECAELEAAVPDDADDGDTEARPEGTDAAGP